MISIIIPIYNVEKFVAECLDSVMRQTFTEYEIIAVDDCGNDMSMEIVKSYAKKLPLTIVNHDHNMGLSAARNSGVKVAKGEYILFIDSDDILADNCLEKLISKAEETSADMVVGKLDTFGDTGDNTPGFRNGIMDVFRGSRGVLMSYISRDYYMMAWNKLIRRDFYEREKISFENGLIHEDVPWALQVACRAECVALVFDVTYHYRIRGNSLQRSGDFTKHLDAFCKIIQIEAEEIKNYLAKNAEITYCLTGWFERQKALLFNEAIKHGSIDDQKKLYKTIHNELPCKGFNKLQLHYYLPLFIAQRLYTRVCGHSLC